MYETGLGEYIYTRDTDWGITRIGVIIYAKIEDKKVLGSGGCLKNVKSGGFKLEPWRKTTTKNKGWVECLLLALSD